MVETAELQIEFEPSNCLQQLLVRLQRLSKAGAKGVIVLVAAGNHFAASDLDTLLQASPVEVIGGVFCGLLYDGKVHHQGAVLLVMQHGFDYIVLDQLSDPTTDIIAQLDQHPVLPRMGNAQLVLVDGFSSRLSLFFQNIYEVFGRHHLFLGGGAGALEAPGQACILTPAGMQRDVAILINFPSLQTVAVDHGWHPIAGPFIVTSAQNNRVAEIDFKPAFEVYRAAIETRLPNIFSEQRFLEIAKSYPIGMSRIDGTFVVRDAFQHHQGAIDFVGEVPENQEIYMLTGDDQVLLKAAANCAEQAVTANARFAFTFDCVSRWLFLEQQFASELAAIEQAFPRSVHHVGVLCAGEIACAGDTALEFHNKTVTVASVGPNCCD